MIVLPCLKLLPEATSQEVCRASFCGADCETSKKPRGPSSAGSVGRDQIKGVNGGSKLPGIKILEKFKKSVQSMRGLPKERNVLEKEKANRALLKILKPIGVNCNKDQTSDFVT